MDETDKQGPIKPAARRWPALIGAGVLLLIVFIAVYLYFHGPQDGLSSTPSSRSSAGSSDTAPPGQFEPVDVQIIKPARRDLTYSITLPANVAPLYQTTLYAKVSGYLKSIGPDKGDLVKKDQVLAVIDAPEVEEQYFQAVADYKIKKLTYERLSRVWKESPDVIAKQDVDVAEAAFQGAKHSMEQREALRGYTKVRAPYDGTITARFADPGALIQVATSSATGAIPLFTIMDLNTVRIYANVPQDDSVWIVPGKTHASLILKEPADHSFTGPVTRTTWALDPSTRSLLVEIDLPNPDHVLRPGTFAEVVLGLREIPAALVVPPQAINSGTTGQSVFIVDQGRAKAIPIQTGISDGRWVEITSGLTGNEDVVVVGKRKLLDGVSVVASPFHLPDATHGQQKFERRSPGREAPNNGTSGIPDHRPVALSPATLTTPAEKPSR
jgi:RND family efflux transporter MFP subunit